MAYRAPRFSYIHAGRAVGVSAFTLSAGSADADFPIDNMIDDRASTLFKWDSSRTNVNFTVDLGATFVADGLSGLDRIIIPANHNIESVYVREDDTAGFGTPTDLHASPGTPDTSPVTGTLADIEFDTASSSQQFIRFFIVGTDLYQIPQYFLTKIVTLSAGPNLADSTDQYRDNVTRLVQPTGLLPTVQHGPQQREIEYVWDSPLEGADLTAMNALIAAVGMSKPFYLDPASFSTPPETDEPVIAVKFAQMPRSANSVLVPMSGQASKTFAIQLIESVD